MPSEVNSNGVKLHEETSIGGNKNGKCMGWYENGSKQFEEEYLDDKLNGKSIKWDVDGNKIREQDWREGEIIKDYLAPIK